MTATKMLYRLNPVTPFTPNAVNIHPPTIAPMIPRITSRKKPSPLLLTILLAINPAISPTIIHAIMPIVLSQVSRVSRLRLFQGVAAIECSALRFRNATFISRPLANLELNAQDDKSKHDRVPSLRHFGTMRVQPVSVAIPSFDERLTPDG